jgi:hypothetical protein
MPKKITDQPSAIRKLYRAPALTKHQWKTVTAGISLPMNTAWNDEEVNQ